MYRRYTDDTTNTSLDHYYRASYQDILQMFSTAARLVRAHGVLQFTGSNS